MRYDVHDNFIRGHLNHGEILISSDETIGYQPYQLLVSSIASCSGAVLRNILKKQRISYERLTVEAEINRNETEANRIEKIYLNFHLYGKELNEEKIKKNMKLVKRHCSMLRSVEGSIAIEEKVIIHESE